MHTESEITLSAAVSASQAVSEPPVLADDGTPWQSLHSTYIVAERVAGGILWAILAVGGLAAVVLLAGLAFSNNLWLCLGCLGGLSLVLSGLAYLFWHVPGWNYATVGWREVERGFEIKRGIWWQHQLFIPRQRIQHTDVVRGPLARRFGLATLVIHTAGTHNHQLRLEGLEYQQAERLRQSLLPQGDRAA